MVGGQKNHRPSERSSAPRLRVATARQLSTGTPPVRRTRKQGTRTILLYSTRSSNIKNGIKPSLVVKEIIPLLAVQNPYSNRFHSNTKNDLTYSVPPDYDVPRLILSRTATRNHLISFSLPPLLPPRLRTMGRMEQTRKTHPQCRQSPSDQFLGSRRRYQRAHDGAHPWKKRRASWS